MTTKFIILLSLCAVFIGCGPGGHDIHDEPREPRAYESIDLAPMDADALLAHLGQLAQGVSDASEKADFLEMHYLEIAINKAIKELMNKLPDASAQAKAQLDLLGTLAMKLHDAGHDQNKTASAKIATKFSSVIEELQAAL